MTDRRSSWGSQHGRDGHPTDLQRTLPASAYGLEGEVRAAPFLNESVGPRREQLPLYLIAVDIWGGFVFVNLTPDATPGEDACLAAQLGEIPDRLKRYPLAELRTGHRISYEVASNWKCIVENYDQCYHCGPVHPELCEVVPAFKRDGGAALDRDEGVPHREGATNLTFTGTTNRASFPDLSEDERSRHKGELIHANLMVSLAADHVTAFTLWPEGPGRTVIDCDFLFHPDEMSKRDFDPTDAVEFWDLVNRQDWRICESVQRGMGSGAYAIGFYAPMEDLSLDIKRYVGERLSR